jgi:hypothetical protein
VGAPPMLELSRLHCTGNVPLPRFKTNLTLFTSPATTRPECSTWNILTLVRLSVLPTTQALGDRAAKVGC